MMSLMIPFNRLDMYATQITCLYAARAWILIALSLDQESYLINYIVKPIIRKEIRNEKTNDIKVVCN